MRILPYTPLDEVIVHNLLSKGDLEVEDIYRELKSENHNVTIQAIYKRLRHLLQSGIIIKNKKQVSISNEWRENLLDLLETTSKVPNLKPGESAAYSFKGLSSLDAYWKHVMAPLERSIPDYPIFFYNPYEIWIQLSDRKESEKQYLHKFSEEKRYAFYLLGKHNQLNEEFKKQYQSEYLQISISPTTFNDRDYITLIADYIITTKLSPKLSKALEAIYSSGKPSDISANINSLFTKPGAIQLKIERNQNKAMRLRRKISKDFYIPKEAKERHNIF